MTWIILLLVSIVVSGFVGWWINGRIQKPAIGRWVGILLFYIIFSLLSFLAPNPFNVAQHEAQRLGNWEDENMKFERGEYQYSPLGSRVEAELTVQTETQPVSAYISLSHSPFSGWVVDEFQAPSKNEQTAIDNQLTHRDEK